MTDDEIIALNAELAHLEGAARTTPLLRLGKAHAERHWRVGPGRPESLADLQESIRAFSEAYGYLPEGDAYRGQAAFMNGFLRGTRATVYPGVGPADDANESIELLEEALGYPNVHPTMAAMGRFMVGQLSLHRVLRGFQSPDLLSSVMRGGGGGMTFAARADADRAAESFREVIAVSTVPEMTQAAQTMLTMAEVVQTLVSGFGGAGIGGFDMSRMLDAVTKLQQFQQTGFRMQMPAAALAAPTSIFDFGTKLAETHPLDRPTVVLSGAQPEQAHPPLSQPPLTLDVDAVRQDLRKLLSTSDDTDVYASAVTLLRADRPPELVDELVALASSVVYGTDDTTATDNAVSATDAADHFVLAAALLLRARRDGTGDELEPGDAEDAATALVASARKLPPDDPDRIPALLFLATLLPNGILPELTEQLASHLTDITTAARALDADALLFPDPADTLRLNASTGHVEPADLAPASNSNTNIVIGSDALTKSDERAASAYPTLLRLIERSRRSQPPPITRQPVFLANPRGDRMPAAADVMLLRRSFYARSRGLGKLIEDSDGAGTADEVRGILGCSLLHLACGITPTGALELADGTELDLATLIPPTTGRTTSSTSIGAGTGAGSAVAILPPGHLHPLADSLLALGFDDVIGWRQSVPDPVAALMLYLLHAELVDHGRPPAAAVARVRRWPHDPERETWTQLPTGYAERLDQSVPQHWTALVHLSA